ncbi:hypothetical protein [Halomonas sp.]|uniref:hypothetical protein n=1 Tax=Halomonas sp. TaxID=1486246 RepID=UPI003A93C5C9
MGTSPGSDSRSLPGPPGATSLCSRAAGLHGRTLRQAKAIAKPTTQLHNTGGRVYADEYQHRRCNMSQQQCACPKCDCAVDSQAIEKNGQKFCSESCAIGHTDGSTGCGHNCSCGK